MIDAVTAALIFEKLERFAVPMENREFSRDEYNRLFPRGAAETPIGKVKLGGNQFEKLKAKNRTDVLGAMYQTLTDPVIILAEDREGKGSYLYIKTFIDAGDGGTTHVMAVAAIIGEESVVISAGKRRKAQIENKIKTAGNFLYLKGEEGGGPTRGTGV